MYMNRWSAHYASNALGDRRITPIGKVSRKKTNLDEVPQFINVLLGTDVVIKCDHTCCDIHEKYSKIIDKFWSDIWVKPGITGWAQVNGYQGEKDVTDMEGRVLADVWYIEIEFRLRY